MDSIFKSELSGNNGHPSQDDLLLYVDGELAPKATSHMRDHLEACWSCRVRTEKIEGAISTFIDYRNQILKPLVEQPSNGWRGFDDKLNRLAGEIGRPSLLANVRSALGRILLTPNFSINLPGLYRPIAVALVLIIVAVALIRFNRTSTVSASDLLNRVADAQQRAIGTTNQAVVYQKLQVRRKTTASSSTDTVIWEVWNDTTSVRARQSVELSGARHFIDEANPAKSPSSHPTTVPTSLSSLTNILLANHMNPAMPLAATSFDAWRNSLSARRDEVTKTKLGDGYDALTLRTAASDQVNNGEVIEASLIVRTGDWHPVQENLRVKNEQGVEEFELAEMAYSIVSLNTLAPEIFPEGRPLAASLMNTPRVAAKEETKTSLGPNVQPVIPVMATADLEVEVLRLLHEARADLGEQISTTIGADGLLHVTGIVETAERKVEIMRSLVPLMNNPACRVEIQTVAEAVAQQQRQSIRSKLAPGLVTEQKVEINNETIAAAAQLRGHFASDQQMREFAARMISQSRGAMRHAYALKRLMAQFSREELRLLSPEAKGKWLGLIRSHAREYQNDVTVLRRELQPIFSPSSSGSVSSAIDIKDEASLASVVEELFNLASANDGVIRSAFATSSESSATSAISSPQFWRSLSNAESLAARLAAVQ